MDNQHAEKIAAALSIIALDKYKDSDLLDQAGIAWTSAYNKLIGLWDDQGAIADPTDPESFEPPVD